MHGVNVAYNSQDLLHQPRLERASMGMPYQRTTCAATQGIKGILYHKLLPAIANFIKVRQFLPFVITDNVKSDHLYVGRLTNDPNATCLWTHLAVYMCFLDAKKLFDRVNHWTTSKETVRQKCAIAYCEIVYILVQRARVYGMMG